MAETTQRGAAHEADPREPGGPPEDGRSPELDAAAVASLAPGRLGSLAGRTALVTGACGGIGRWLAAGLGAAGADLVLTDLDRAGLETVARLLAEAGVTCTTVPADLGAPEVPDQLVEHAVAAGGRLDVLVNCAMANRRERILDVEPATFDHLLGIGLKAPYFLSRAAARAMSGDGGSIIHIGSLTVAVGLEEVSVYGAAKAALSQLARSMAVEWSHLGIRTNCLAPGFMLTPLSQPIWADGARSRWILDRVPMRRAGLPADLVGACTLLASEAGAFINGQTLFVDGGFLAGSPWDEAPP